LIKSTLASFYSVVKNLVFRVRSEIVGYAIENGRQEYRIQESEFRIQNGVVVVSLLRILKIDLAEGQFLILAPDFWLLYSMV
jgi:hypothetical protein